MRIELTPKFLADLKEKAKYVYLDNQFPDSRHVDYAYTFSPDLIRALIERIEELEANNYGPEILNDPQALTTAYFAGAMAEGRKQNREADRLYAENNHLKEKIAALEKEHEAEIKHLQNIIDFQTSAIAEYKQVAKMAWGGEIPSPLPGHESSEEKMVECFEYLNCPCCGGSGHVGDCDNAIQEMKCSLAGIKGSYAKAQTEIERLEKEADWLAEQLSRLANRLLLDANGNLVSSCPGNATYMPVFYCIAGHGSCKDCWREAARKAVEKENETHKAQMDEAQER